MVDEILTFWFEDTREEQYWRTDPEFDRTIAARFGDVHRAAAQCELSDWRATADGRLAEILVLDQFSRNLHRDSPLAFAQDPLALALAQEAIAAGADKALQGKRRKFLYMPYMHSESRKIHADAVPLFATTGNDKDLEFELKHKAIIDRFGRYPHRNALLGRASTPEEKDFLAERGRGF